MNRIDDFGVGSVPRIPSDYTSSGTPANITINFTVNQSTVVHNHNHNRSDKMKTIVVLSPGEDEFIVASCPSLPGCRSQGKTREEAIKNVKEAIEIYREVLAETEAKELEVLELEV